MIIGYKEIAVIGILHSDKIPKGAKIVSKMEISGRPDTTEHCFHKTEAKDLVKDKNRGVDGGQK